MKKIQIYHGSSQIVSEPEIRSAFWELARFKRPTHQISFHTIAALQTIRFTGEEKVYG